LRLRVTGIDLPPPYRMLTVSAVALISRTAPLGAPPSTCSWSKLTTPPRLAANAAATFAVNPATSVPPVDVSRLPLALKSTAFAFDGASYVGTAVKVTAAPRADSAAHESSPENASTKRVRRIVSSYRPFLLRRWPTHGGQFIKKSTACGYGILRK
jgi:hypothetical protein